MIFLRYHLAVWMLFLLSVDLDVFFSHTLWEWRKTKLRHLFTWFTLFSVRMYPLWDGCCGRKVLSKLVSTTSVSAVASCSCTGTVKMWICTAACVNMWTCWCGFVHCFYSCTQYGTVHTEGGSWMYLVIWLFSQLLLCRQKTAFVYCEYLTQEDGWFSCVVAICMEVCSRLTKDFLSQIHKLCFIGKQIQTCLISSDFSTVRIRKRFFIHQKGNKSERMFAGSLSLLVFKVKS